MVEDLHATHPLIAGDDRQLRNDPSPATARAKVAGFAGDQRLPTVEIDNTHHARSGHQRR